MKLVVLIVVVLALWCSTESKTAPAKVQVYSHYPGKFGQDNILMCYVTGFHPPNIEIQLLRNGEEIPNAVQTDLAFREGWYFHLMKNVAFKPMKDDVYLCRVTHQGVPKDYAWQINM
ncbi:beta-2-microglobulin [Thalassophryne amazonica]|uniref:beta-2-microglobulin n=1 Tax=Thalassophryne amazonica TaxID=390379 RepID=UPI001470A703|nr:beta-2-microglobulin [Thalassophryne amazonica]